MYTIRDLCGISKLSRSAILYYETLGLLKSAGRSASNYRLYSDESITVLKKICLYREAGVSLEDIKALLNISENGDISIAILENTLARINGHIRDLQRKQKRVVDMIKAINGKEVIDDMEFLDCLEDQIRRDAYDINKYLWGSE